MTLTLKTLKIPGVHLLERMTGGGSDTFKVPFLKIFVPSKSHFLNFLLAQGPIFKFLFILGPYLYPSLRHDIGIDNSVVTVMTENFR